MRRVASWRWTVSDLPSCSTSESKRADTDAKPRPTVMEVNRSLIRSAMGETLL
jgi:hypothetical protein